MFWKLFKKTEPIYIQQVGRAHRQKAEAKAPEIDPYLWSIFHSLITRCCDPRDTAFHAVMDSELRALELLCYGRIEGEGFVGVRNKIRKHRGLLAPSVVAGCVRAWNPASTN